MSRRCPRCGDTLPTGPGAISRADNRTIVCPACGRDEALLEYVARIALRHPSRIAHRYDGWIHPPTTRGE